MSLSIRLHYYRRILPAYLGSGRSQLTFWHETPAANPQATVAQFGPYYMLFREKADYAGHHDANGIPMLDYRGAIGLQYNPIAIAQWGLANNNMFCETKNDSRLANTLNAANWLVAKLEQNPHGLWVWNHHFNWDYRDTLKAPWYSGLAQGQGISLLLRAYAQTNEGKYQQAAECAFISLSKTIAEGGVLHEDQDNNLWIEEYLVNPPTHILNGFIWALWGVFDYWRAVECSAGSPARESCSADTPVRESQNLTARNIFDRGVQTLLTNLARYDTGYWSLYEQSGTRLKMLASPFYHRLHVVQLRVMATLTGEPRFTEFANRWELYAKSRANRTRALIEKSIFKLVHY
jgi:hypothetical protein